MVQALECRSNPPLPRMEFNQVLECLRLKIKREVEFGKHSVS